MVPPSPSLGLSFLGCKKEIGAMKLCFWEQVLPLRNGDKAQHWGRGWEGEKRELLGRKRVQMGGGRGDLGH